MRAFCLVLPEDPEEFSTAESLLLLLLSHHQYRHLGHLGKSEVIWKLDSENKTYEVDWNNALYIGIPVSHSLYGLPWWYQFHVCFCVESIFAEHVSEIRGNPRKSWESTGITIVIWLFSIYWGSPHFFWVGRHVEHKWGYPFISIGGWPQQWTCCPLGYVNSLRKWP